MKVATLDQALDTPVPKLMASGMKMLLESSRTIGEAAAPWEQAMWDALAATAQAAGNISALCP
jgi:hypothetical protein